MARKDDLLIIGRRFGKYIHGLRSARNKTQEQLAEAAGLSPDTIRRLERGLFSPSLDTLLKIVKGLRIDLEALFAGFERGQVGGEHELIAMARGLSEDERRAGIRILLVLSGLLSTTPPKVGPMTTPSKDDRDDGEGSRDDG